MFDKVKKYIDRNNLITPGDLIIAAVSGGPDSMALLHILQRLAPEMNLRIVVAHLNHQLRPEADAEEEFVRGYCEGATIPFYSRTVNVEEIVDREKRSLEEAGRDSRYQFFNDIKRDLGGGMIATAHHQDDRAEGILINLIRGTGIRGLRGIMSRNGRVIRPLLSVTKNEIMAYLQENNLEYCIDYSNSDTVYLRNRIRHGLLPYLRDEFNPRIVEGLNQLADIALEENDWIEQQCDHAWPDIALPDGGRPGVTLDAARLAAMHPAMQRRLILRALAEFGGEQGWTTEDVSYVLALLKKSGSSRFIQLRKGVRVNKVYNELHFAMKTGQLESFYYDVPIPGQIRLVETGGSLVFAVKDNINLDMAVNEMHLDFDKIKEEGLVIRSRQPGDFFHPAGMSGRKKLKDYFIDLKVPHSRRNVVPVLASNRGTIYAIIGFRVANEAAVSPATKRVLVIRSELAD